MNDPVNRIDMFGLDSSCTPTDGASSCVFGVAPQLDICGPDPFADCESGGPEDLPPEGLLPVPAGAGDPRITPILNRLKQALMINSACSALFGGLANALNAMARSTFQEYTPGMALPPVVDATALAQHLSWANASTAFAVSGPPSGFVFLASRFFNYPLSGINENNELAPQQTQTNMMFHELEHITTQQGDAQMMGEDTFGAEMNDLNNFQQNCQPIQIPTENPLYWNL